MKSVKKTKAWAICRVILMARQSGEPLLNRYEILRRAYELQTEMGFKQVKFNRASNSCYFAPRTSRYTPSSASSVIVKGFVRKAGVYGSYTVYDLTKRGEKFLSDAG